jgi:hypothetical protein
VPEPEDSRHEPSPDAAAEEMLRRAEAHAIAMAAAETSARNAASAAEEALRQRQREQDDAFLARIEALQTEIRHLKAVALFPRNGFLRLFVRDLETNPHAQYKVHKWGMWYWLVNFPLVTLLFFLAPTVWLKWGLYITLIYSIYANFATDYGGMSAAMAAYEDRPGLPPIPVAPVNGLPDKSQS